MKQLLRICLTGAFFLLFEGLLSPMLADNGKSDKEILVLNSINFNLPWARNFYWYVHDVLQEQGITARAESLSVPALAGYDGGKCGHRASASEISASSCRYCDNW